MNSSIPALPSFASAELNPLIPLVSRSVIPFAISTSRLTCVITLDITPVSIPEIESEYPLIPSPNLIRLLPNVPKSLSPVKKLISPPVFGSVFASSTKAFPAIVEFVIASGSIPVSATEYASIDAPNITSCVPNFPKSLSPVNQLTNPPVFGTVLANSIRAFPAVAEFTIASAFRPLTASPKFFIALPNGTSFLPNVSISLLPVNQLTTPPVFGIVAAISVIALPAIAASVTAFAFNPSTASPNFIIALPNGTSCFPNSSISLFPAKNPISPPVLGIVEAISAKAFPAVAALATTFPSKSPIATEKSLIASPKGTSSSPNLDKDEPPVSQEVNPCKISAAVRMSTVSAKALTPSIIDG